jgi:ribonuclease HI
MLHLVSKHFSGGWGFVITNEIGEAVAAVAGRIENVSNPLQAEAMACYQALTFVAEQGMVALEVETDCL